MYLPLRSLQGSNHPLFENLKEVEQPNLNTRISQMGSELMISFEIKDKNIEEATELAYQEAFQFAGELGQFFIVRIWNVVPEINKMSLGVENYQRFCDQR